MTKTALANKELAEKAALRYSKESIAQKDRASREDIAAKDRKSAEKMGHWKNVASVTSAGIGAVGKAAGAMVGAGIANDPAWYKKYPIDLDKFVNVPSYQRLGATTYQFNGVAGNKPISGICVADWYPTIGAQKINSSGVLVDIVTNPINAILQRSKEQVLKLNSRSSVSWEAGDLGYNLIASSQIAAMIFDLRRVLCAALTYSGTNAYFGDTMIAAMGYTPKQIRASLSDIKAQLELLTVRFNHSVVTPTSLSLTERWVYLNNVVMRDRAIEPAQTMFYRQLTAYCLSDDGSKLEGVALMTKRKDIYSYFDFVNLCITRITDNADFTEMYQDLRAAFGKDIYQIPSLPMDAVLAFSDDVLNRNQWHNIVTLPSLSYTWMGASSLQPSNDIQQDPSGYLYQSGGTVTAGILPCTFVSDTTPATTTGYLSLLNEYYSLDNHRLINGYDHDVNGDFILDATRFQIFGSVGAYTDESHTAFYVSNSGTEIIGKLHFFTEPTTNPDTQVLRGDLVICTVNGLTIAQVATAFGTFSKGSSFMSNLVTHSEFDWNPIVTFCLTDSTGANYHWGPIGDLATCFEVSSKTLANINNACVLSEFYLDSSTFNGRGR